MMPLVPRALRAPARRVAWAAALGLAAAASWAVAGCNADTDAVAVVAGTPITADALTDAYVRLVVQAGLPGDDPRVREDVLESLISRQLVIQDALDSGIRETDAYREEEERARRKMMVDHYTYRELYDTLRVREGDLRRLFAQTKTTYEARHLYARTQGQARALRQRLLAGETFEALARETFADTALANSGGYVGEFAHDEMDPAFEAACFRLPVGAVSEPVRTAMGYSVIRVENRATSPLLTESEYLQKRGRLEQYERRRRRTEARFAHSRRVRDELAPRFEEEALDRLAALAAGAGPALTPDALEAWHRRPLVRFTSVVRGRQTWTVGDVERLAETAGDEQRAAVVDRASLYEFIEGLMVREELLARAREEGYDRGEVYERAVERAMEGWVFTHAQHRLRLAMAPPEDTLRAYFAAHRADFAMPERVRVAEILVETRREAAVLKAQLEDGADFHTLARRHSLRPGAAATGGDLGPVDRAGLGRLAREVFDARPGALLGPLEIAGRYALLLRGPTERARPMTFDEARADVEGALELTYARTQLAQYVAGLRRRYPVEVNEAAVRRLRLLS